jgi:hypothetical protein
MKRRLILRFPALKTENLKTKAALSNERAAVKTILNPIWVKPAPLSCFPSPAERLNRNIHRQVSWLDVNPLIFAFPDYNNPVARKEAVGHTVAGAAADFNRFPYWCRPCWAADPRIFYSIFLNIILC